MIRLLLLALALAPASASAMWPPNAPAPKPADPAPPPPVLEKVEIVERLDAQVPLDAEFTGPAGERVRLGDLLGEGRPIVLAPVYYECPMLCGLVLGGMATGLRETGFEPGKEFDAITLSFDPRETSRLAAQRQRTYVSRAGFPGKEAHWPFLTGTEAEIRRVTDAVGFHYAWDEQTKQYAHAAALVVLTPDGRVSRYLYGVDFPARDLRLAIVEAADGRVGTSFDRILLTCFRYDPASRRYMPYVMGFIRLGSLAVLGALAVTLGVFWRREWKGRGGKGGAR
jgi:protein SCO1/2